MQLSNLSQILTLSNKLDSQPEGEQVCPEGFFYLFPRKSRPSDLDSITCGLWLPGDWTRRVMSRQVRHDSTSGYEPHHFCQDIFSSPFEIHVLKPRERKYFDITKPLRKEWRLIRPKRLTGLIFKAFKSPSEFIISASLSDDSQLVMWPLRWCGHSAGAEYEYCHDVGLKQAWRVKESTTQMANTFSCKLRNQKSTLLSIHGRLLKVRTRRTWRTLLIYAIDEVVCVKES
jgi:hypothetical protein